MFAEEPQHAFVGPCEDVARHAAMLYVSDHPIIGGGCQQTGDCPLYPH
jgi:hypothetical protein